MCTCVLPHNSALDYVVLGSVRTENVLPLEELKMHMQRRGRWVDRQLGRAMY